MGADFRDAMRDQFDAGQERFASDPFANESASVIVGRVKRRRVVTNVAVGGGTFIAAGALVVAAMQAPFQAAMPAASPQICVTTTPSGEPVPVASVALDPTDETFNVELPDGKGMMTLAYLADGTDDVDVTFPDGSVTSVDPEGDHSYFIFALPDGSPVVAVFDFDGFFKVSVGDVSAQVLPATTTAVPQVVTATGDPFVECGNASDVGLTSPFQCGFPITNDHVADALAIERADYMTVPEAEAKYSTTARIVNPIVVTDQPLVPVVQVVSNETSGSSLAVGQDPALERPDKTLGLTGVSIVKVLDGVVVAVASDGEPAPSPAPSPGAVWGLVAGDGLWLFATDASFFESCPGVTSTDGAELYAVAGSQTWDRHQAGDSPVYVWKKFLAAD